MIDFSSPFLYNFLTGLVYDHPTTEIVNVWVFTKIFVPEVWIFSAATVIALMLYFVLGSYLVNDQYSPFSVSSICVLFSIPLTMDNTEMVSQISHQLNLQFVKTTSFSQDHWH